MTLTEFADIMPDVVSWQPEATTDGYHKDTFGAAVEIPCRVASRARIIRNLAGEEKLSGTQIWLNGIYGVGVSDKITLPDGSTPVIILVETVSTILPHEKVWLA